MSDKKPANSFPLADGTKGYDFQEVDAYFATLKEAFESQETSSDVSSREVRNISFNLRKKGYDARHVDAALDRLEEIFFAREKQLFIEEYGTDEWKKKTSSLLQEIMGRIDRDPNAKFKKQSVFAYGYKRSQVDAALEQIAQVITSAQETKTAKIRLIKFHPQRGGYSEAQVDEFLDAVVEYLLSRKK